MKFQLNIMPSNSIVLALEFLSFAEDITYLNLPSCVGTKNSMAPKLPCLINPTDPSLNIPMHTQMKNWNGYKIITDVTLKYLFVNCMANSALQKVITDTLALCTAFIVSWVIRVLLHPQRTEESQSLMILLLNLELSGKWMLNMSQLSAILAPYRKNSISTQ